MDPREEKRLEIMADATDLVAMTEEQTGFVESDTLSVGLPVGTEVTKVGTQIFASTPDYEYVGGGLVDLRTTPSLEDVIVEGGDVDITSYSDTDRAVSFLDGGVRKLSVFGDGKIAAAESEIAKLGAGTVQIQSGLSCPARATFAGASDTGASISVVDQPAVGGELFDVIDFASDTEGLYTLSAQVDVDYGETCYEFTSGGGTTYYAYKGNVNTEAYWFVGTTILTGLSAFVNCQYRSANPVTLPSVFPSEAGGFTGVNAPDTAQQGAFANQSGSGDPSISAETIYSKNTIGIITGTTTQAELQGMIDAGVTVFYTNASSGVPTIPAGTYQLLPKDYYINSRYRLALGGDVTFNYATITGPLSMKFDGELTLGANLTISGAGVPVFFDTVHVSGSRTITSDSNVRLFYFSDEFGSGTINAGTSTQLEYQFKDTNTTIGTGSISQLNWKYPITQS